MISNKAGWAAREDAAIIKAHNKGTAAELADKFGKPAWAVRRRAARLGIVLLRSEGPPRKKKKVAAAKSTGRKQRSPFKRWTKDDLKTLKRDYGTIPAAKIAKAMGRSPQTVYRRAAMLGLAQGQDISQKEKNFIRDNILRMGVQETARRIDRSERTVRREIKRQGLLDVGGMTVKQERALRNYNPETKTIAALAREVGWTDYRTLRTLAKLSAWNERSKKSKR
jgi:hypothetical protein